MPPIEKNYPGREPLPFVLCLNRTTFCPFCLPQRGPLTHYCTPTLAGDPSGGVTGLEPTGGEG